MNMKILCLDTSSDKLLTGLYQNGSVLKEIRSSEKRSHGMLLVPTIEKLLDDLKLTTKDIDALAVDIGPGSFTGLRIGVTVAKTLSFSLKIPLRGISSLEIAASSLPKEENLIVPVMDARRGNVYTASYRNLEGYPRRQSDFLLIRRRDLVKQFTETVTFIEEPFNLSIAELGRLAERDFKKGISDDPMSLVPLYIYPDDCQVKNDKNLRRLRKVA